ncbi:hypothetical protein LSH36_913g00004 [Paralvinella palmiformis]|uniref:Uncharacterized protein n=1 Tax=Paralvinella palmiformis TaxID=53620 RepID=A0AAD9IXI3_9ANNE|nr:hypothetical protein LSH36_913g00004 [Paralvinella palmiformis]
MMHERDRKRATHLFKRTPSLSQNKSTSLEGDQWLGTFEPDWSKFESVYANGKWPLYELCTLVEQHNKSATAFLSQNALSLSNNQLDKTLCATGLHNQANMTSCSGINHNSPRAPKLLPCRGGQMKTSSFLLEVVDILVDYVRKSNDRSAKVLDFHHPHTLKEMMGHCLDLQEDPQNLEQILSDCKETLKYCVKTGKYSGDV